MNESHGRFLFIAAGALVLGSDFRNPGAGAGSGGRVFGSIDEAIRHAERFLGSGIIWDKN
jgi:hypothetical protein